jgi:hypothetical protein
MQLNAYTINYIIQLLKNVKNQYSQKEVCHEPRIKPHDSNFSPRFW